MPRNGSGVYSLPSGVTAVSATTIASASYNLLLSDLVTDMNDPRPVVAGGTGASSAAAARTNLGLAIGTNVQAQNATLATIASQGNVDTAQIADDAVTGAKIADDAVLPSGVTATTQPVGTNDQTLATTEHVSQKIVVLPNVNHAIVTGTPNNTIDATDLSFIHIGAGEAIHEISGGVEGQHLWIAGSSVASPSTLWRKDVVSGSTPAANILLVDNSAGSVSITDSDFIHLFYFNGNWNELARSTVSASN